ncbi:beta-3 adrenergic receptor-like [Patiria miniata]|uniref:G-protein coupled receptors family 1 profile domain-containing protein n=1 Tax=Patiria miniata TaxID=46514 RepID=A0A914ADX6_PATMI|nr:beta-3 adrenergic receptor-like [Patiria miniata]
MSDEDPSPVWFNVLRCILLTITTILIICGNSFCLIVLRRVNGIHEVTRLFMASLAVSDLITGLFVASPMIVSTAMDRWPYGDVFCGIYGVGKYVCYYTGLISLIAVTVERYIVVVSPLRYNTIVTLFRARVAVACIWLFAFAITMFFGVSVHFIGDVDDDEDNCSLDTSKGDFWHYPLKYMAVAFIILPVVTVLVLYSHILLIARRQIRQIAAITPLGPMSDEERASMKTRKANRRAAGTFLIVTMTFAMAWMPSAVRKLNKLATGNGDTMYTEFLARFCMLSNSWLNVFVYYVRNDSFKYTARRYIAALIGRRGSDDIEISY